MYNRKKVPVMSQPKAISRKHLSLICLFTMYSTPQSQIQFFFDLKWPNGFVCPHCVIRIAHIIQRKVSMNVNAVTVKLH